MSARTQGAGLEFRRVQRPTGDLPVVHLEGEIPVRDTWHIRVDGLVSEPRVWSIDEIRCRPPEMRVLDLNCVWGWVRPSCRWEGISAGDLLEAARPDAEGRFVVAEAAPGGPEEQARVYASCLSIDEARRSLLAWKLDGRDLQPEHGGPVRLVPPAEKWGYKGVKWLTRLSVVDSFKPGFWEEMVGNPVGDIPSDLLDNRFE